MNFAEFSPDYDTYEGLPDWARRTLKEHASDEREHVYTRRQLEAAKTHDPFWMRR